MNASANPPREQHGKSPQEVAFHLVWHAFWATIAFVTIVFIAIGLGHFLAVLEERHLVEMGSFLYWMIRVAEYVLETIDFAMLVGVVAKTAWQLLRGL